MKAQETEVVLNGGLGNQFFQLAAGLFKSGQNNLILRSELGNPRKSSKGNCLDFSSTWRRKDIYFSQLSNFLSDFWNENLAY